MSKETDRAKVDFYTKVLKENGFDVKPEDFLGKCGECGEEDRFVTMLLDDTVEEVFLCGDCRKDA